MMASMRVERADALVAVAVLPTRASARGRCTVAARLRVLAVAAGIAALGNIYHGTRSPLLHPAGSGCTNPALAGYKATFTPGGHDSHCWFSGHICDLEITFRCHASGCMTLLVRYGSLDGWVPSNMVRAMKRTCQRRLLIDGPRVLEVDTKGGVLYAFDDSMCEAHQVRQEDFYTGSAWVQPKSPPEHIPHGRQCSNGLEACPEFRLDYLDANLDSGGLPLYAHVTVASNNKGGTGDSYSLPYGYYDTCAKGDRCVEKRTLLQAYGGIQAQQKVVPISNPCSYSQGFARVVEERVFDLHWVPCEYLSPGPVSPTVAPTCPPRHVEHGGECREYEGLGSPQSCATIGGWGCTNGRALKDACENQEKHKCKGCNPGYRLVHSDAYGPSPRRYHGYCVPEETRPCADNEVWYRGACHTFRQTKTPSEEECIGEVGASYACPNGRAGCPDDNGESAKYNCVDCDEGYRLVLEHTSRETVTFQLGMFGVRTRFLGFCVLATA